MMLTPKAKMTVLHELRKAYKEKLSELCAMAGYEDLHTVAEDALDSHQTVPTFLKAELAGDKQAYKKFNELTELSYMVMALLWEV